MLNGKMKLEVTLKSLADVLDAGASGGSISAMRLWYLHYNAGEEQRSRHFQNRAGWRYKSVDWQTVINRPITASTSTDFDISGFHGSLNTLYIFNKSTANKVTANDYYLLSDISDSKVRADGDQMYNADSRNTQLLIGLLHDRQMTDATFGDGLVVNFGFASPQDKSIEYSGSLHLNDVNDLRVTELTAADTGVIDICGEFDVDYMINAGGEIKRLR